MLRDALRLPAPESCRLTIVADDPGACSLATDGVKVDSGITDPRDIAALYRSAHLLVLPTGYDMYSNVICEGLAHGLPFVPRSQAAIGFALRHAGGVRQFGAGSVLRASATGTAGGRQLGKNTGPVTCVTDLPVVADYFYPVATERLMAACVVRPKGRYFLVCSVGDRR